MYYSLMGYITMATNIKFVVFFILQTKNIILYHQRADQTSTAMEKN